MNTYSSCIFDTENKKLFNQYSIKLCIFFDSLKISIRKNLFELYESNFNSEYLQANKLFKGLETIQEIKDFINGLIDQNNIKIEEDENKNFLKFTLISLLSFHPSVELTINKKPKLSEEIIDLLIEQIEQLKKDNENLKQKIKCNINQKIELIEKENKINNEEIKKLIEEKRIKLNNCENKINELETRINKMELSNKEIITNELESRINKIVSSNKEIIFKELESRINKRELLNKKTKINKKVQLTECNLTKESTIDVDKNSISSVSVFPSGNIVSVSYFKAIKIFDTNYKIIQNILKAHEDIIKYVDIKDDNNFVTCSSDKNIKTWIKINNKFKRNLNILNAHDNSINKVIYYSNHNLISCSNDKTIKIWEEKTDQYQLIKTLNHSEYVNSILVIQNKLISSGNEGTTIWDLNKNIENIKQINYFKKVCCDWGNSLSKIDEDRIIIGGEEIIKIISLKEEKIIKDIKIPFDCYGIKTIENKGIFIVGGNSKDIMIFRCDNYECLNIIKDAHIDSIKGFIELNDETIGSFSNDKTMIIWSF